MSSCRLLMQRGWRLFYQNFVFGRNKKWKFFGDIILVIKIINSSVLIKLQSCSRISALCLKGHCTSRFKRAMCISCRPHVEGGLAHVDACEQGKGGQKSDFCLGRHEWISPCVCILVS